MSLVSVGVSYNLPKFSSCASWNPNGITFADYTTVGTHPFAVFVDKNNTVYVSDQDYSRVQVWREDSVTPTRTLSDYRLIQPQGLFVTSNGDIFVSYCSNSQVHKWSWNMTSSVPVVNFSATCFGLFIDKNNNLYCSLLSSLQVVMITLGNSTNMITNVAGDGSSGTTRNKLLYHYSIFVDLMLNLYVADCGSNSVLLFQPGQSSGIIVAGIRAAVSFQLHCPTGIVLDADGYLFIVDSGNNRIVRSGPNGFRCVVGCSDTSGSASNQLNSPFALSFDSYGNIFVTDQKNHRVQKFVLATNSCADG
ncbi:unnamed protein product [Rotaria magnacalcarata]|uniref:NHL repeat-containing protein n=2 Tax=Rotaria magnacalcarata TaxID=392030 RepID=A0A816X415_9BILA|nr:unnamed protein product [Rotaria magnacalcarata]CAF2142049.1 unnamed protein product [Rotaria magnacalcarata]CAF3923689.1 unnamed protein product [Rotaria magnacalcarata]CAF3991422.1 unnamed protein product [Rotaria magnacalcarata]